MTLGSIIIISGFVFASSCALSGTVTGSGLHQGKRFAGICLVVGIVVDVVFKMGLV